jgi:hypothetical protein
VIKALTEAKPDGSRLLMLGLSDANWTLLRTHPGKPIPVRLQDLDPSLPPLTVLIIAGPDEESMYQDLRAAVPIRQVHGRPEEPPP